MCGPKATSVVCISIPDAHDYLAKSYRPYQDRNNKLAATYDGAHGQGAQVQLGLAALQNGTTSSPTALADAGNKSEQAQGTVLNGGNAECASTIMATTIAAAIKETMLPIIENVATNQTKVAASVKEIDTKIEDLRKENNDLRKKIEEEREKDRKEIEEKHEKVRNEYQAKFNQRFSALENAIKQKGDNDRAELLAGKAPASPKGASAAPGTSASTGSSSSAGASSSASAATSVSVEQPEPRVQEKHWTAPEFFILWELIKRYKLHGDKPDYTGAFAELKNKKSILLQRTHNAIYCKVNYLKQAPQKTISKSVRVIWSSEEKRDLMIVLDKYRKHNSGGNLNMKAITKEIRDKYPSLSSRTDWAINDKIHRLMQGNDPDGKSWNVWSEQEVDELKILFKKHYGSLVGRVDYNKMLADAKRRKMDIAWRSKAMIQAKITDLDLRRSNSKDDVHQQATSKDDLDDDHPLIYMNMAKDMKNAKEWTREEDDALFQACVKHEHCKYEEDGFLVRVMDELKAGPAAKRTKAAVSNRIYGIHYRYPSIFQRQTEAQVVDFDKVMEGVNKSAKEMIGETVWAWWEADEHWYLAEIINFKVINGKLHAEITWEDGDTTDTMKDFAEQIMVMHHVKGPADKQWHYLVKCMWTDGYLDKGYEKIHANKIPLKLLNKYKADMLKKRSAAQAGLQPGGRKKAVARVIPNEGYRELETAPGAGRKKKSCISIPTLRRTLRNQGYDEKSDEGEVVAGRV